MAIFEASLAVGLGSILLIVLYLISLCRKFSKEFQAFRALMYSPESVRVDSPFLAGVPPPCTLQFTKEERGKKVLVGHGMRIRLTDNEYVLVAPSHVIRLAGRNAWVTSSGRYDSDKAKYNDSIQVNDVEWKILLNDVAVATKPANKLNKFKSLAVGPVAGSVMAMISTGLSDQQASMGFLTSYGFGLLKYSGSTKPGFSGAPYVVNQKIVGMHLGGGSLNVGVSASYVLAKLRRTPVDALEPLQPGIGAEDLCAYAPEAYGGSELEFLKRSLKQGAESEWKVATMGSPDEIEVEYRGVYFVLDIDDYHELRRDLHDKYGEDYVEQAEERGRKRKGKYRDYDNEGRGHMTVGVQVSPEMINAVTQTRKLSVSTVEVQTKVATRDQASLVTFEGVVESCSCGNEAAVAACRSRNIDPWPIVQHLVLCNTCIQKRPAQLEPVVERESVVRSGNELSPEATCSTSGPVLVTEQNIQQKPQYIIPAPSTTSNLKVTNGPPRIQQPSKPVLKYTHVSASAQTENNPQPQKKLSSRRARRRKQTRSGSPPNMPQTGRTQKLKLTSGESSGTSTRTQSPDLGDSRITRTSEQRSDGMGLSSTQMRTLHSLLRTLEKN